jgi:SH3-like domain-containing protein
MTNKTSHISFVALLTIAFAVLAVFGVSYAADTKDAFRSTAFPLPRFVSLSSDEVFVRSGPGSRYPVKYVYRKKGLPVEVILEYEVWRKIKDFEGETGWVHQSLISGKRTGMVKDGENVSLLQKPKDSARKAAVLQPRVIIGLESCKDEWCKVSASGYKGFLKRESVWGVYEKETLD